MLVLMRRVSELVCIGDDITVQVLGIKGNQVRLGISAPKTVPVHREEVYLQIHGTAVGESTQGVDGGA